MPEWDPASKLSGSDQSGYTLVEFLAVAVILILLAAIPLPIFLNATDKAREARSAKELRTIEGALEVYQAERGHYPKRLEVLVELGYLKPTSFKTPWSEDIYYLYAVDTSASGKAKAYALADPGPRCTEPVSKKGTVSRDLSQPLPCGRKPSTTAYVMGPGGDSEYRLVDGDGNPFPTPEYLTNYRTDIRTDR